MSKLNRGMHNVPNYLIKYTQKIITEILVVRYKNKSLKTFNTILELMTLRINLLLMSNRNKDSLACKACPMKIL